jgi:NADH-quinone oxidoreductase subunit N
LGQLLATSHGLSDPVMATTAFSVLLVLTGLAFKLSLFPFHFWCPDAFQGAPAEVAGFLSVASKGAAFALLVRFCLALIGPGAPTGGMAQVSLGIGLGLGVIAAVTATYGNLAAYTQTNAKRLLAYSTIAHAGYMLMAVAALMVIESADVDPAVRSRQATDAVQGLLYYLVVYLFMNLGAFAIVALIRNQVFSEDLSDYSGLVWQAPWLTVGMAFCLFSLVGLPPFGGFVGKFMIFASLFVAGEYHPMMWAVLVIGGLNTVFSLFYYVRVLSFMIFGQSPVARRWVGVAAPEAGLVALLSAGVLVTGVFVGPLSRLAQSVAATFFL